MLLEMKSFNLLSCLRIVSERTTNVVPPTLILIMTGKELGERDRRRAAKGGNIGSGSERVGRTSLGRIVAAGCERGLSVALRLTEGRGKVEGEVSIESGRELER